MLVRPAMPRSTKVMVVIPAYNAARTICCAVDGALDQTQPRVERLLFRSTMAGVGKRQRGKRRLPGNGFKPGESEPHAWELVVSSAALSARS